jgi:hypothetical protein
MQREQYQISATSYAEASPIPGSGGAWIVRRFYLTDDSPSGAYTVGEPGYIRATSAYAAVCEFVDSLVRGGIGRYVEAAS